MSLIVDIVCPLSSFDLRAHLVAEAGITVLFGPSGAGKTTLLNALAGLVTPRRGRIRLNAQTLYDDTAGIDVPAHRRGIGYVFQDARLFPHMTVADNLDYGRRRRRTGPEGLARDDVIALLGLAALLHRMPATLSGGEAQRVAIGRALLSNATLLLLDEPLASLDAPRRLEILDYLRAVARAYPHPILYVSHRLEEVTALADQLVVLERGTVVAAGPLGPTLTDPKVQPLLGITDPAAVAGPVTVIEAAPRLFEPGDGLLTLGLGAQSLVIPASTPPASGTLRVAIRASDVALSLDPPGRSSLLNQLRGTITGLTIRHGPACDVTVTLDDGPALVARITRRSAQALELKAGLAVWALVKAAALDIGRTRGNP